MLEMSKCQWTDSTYVTGLPGLSWIRIEILIVVNLWNFKHFRHLLEFHFRSLRSSPSGKAVSALMPRLHFSAAKRCCHSGHKTEEMKRWNGLPIHPAIPKGWKGFPFLMPIGWPSMSQIQVLWTHSEWSFVWCVTCPCWMGWWLGSFQCTPRSYHPQWQERWEMRFETVFVAYTGSIWAYWSLCNHACVYRIYM